MTFLMIRASGCLQKYTHVSLLGTWDLARYINKESAFKPPTLRTDAIPPMSDCCMRPTSIYQGRVYWFALKKENGSFGRIHQKVGKNLFDLLVGFLFLVVRTKFKELENSYIIFQNEERLYLFLLNILLFGVETNFLVPWKLGAAQRPGSWRWIQMRLLKNKALFQRGQFLTCAYPFLSSQPHSLAVLSWHTALPTSLFKDMWDHGLLFLLLLLFCYFLLLLNWLCLVPASLPAIVLMLLSECLSQDCRLFRTVCDCLVSG